MLWRHSHSIYDASSLPWRGSILLNTIRFFVCKIKNSLALGHPTFEDAMLGFKHPALIHAKKKTAAGNNKAKTWLKLRNRPKTVPYVKTELKKFWGMSWTESQVAIVGITKQDYIVACCGIDLLAALSHFVAHVSFEIDGANGRNAAWRKVARYMFQKKDAR